MSEAALSGRIVKWFRAQDGVWARKVSGGSFGSAGEPDIDVVWRGVSIKIEVKLPGKLNTLTELQKLALERWGQAGSVVGVVTSLDEVKDLLARNGIDLTSQQ